MLRDLVIAISLANVFFVRSWQKLLGLDVPYHAQDWPSSTQHLAMMLNVLGIGVACWATVTLARRARSRLPLQIAQLGFLLVVLMALPYQFLRASTRGDLKLVIRNLVSLSETVGSIGPLLLHLLWLALVVAIFARWRRRVVGELSLLLLILSPRL